MKRPVELLVGRHACLAPDDSTTREAYARHNTSDNLGSDTLRGPAPDDHQAAREGDARQHTRRRNYHSSMRFLRDRPEAISALNRTAKQTDAPKRAPLAWRHTWIAASQPKFETSANCTNRHPGSAQFPSPFDNLARRPTTELTGARPVALRLPRKRCATGCRVQFSNWLGDAHTHSCKQATDEDYAQRNTSDNPANDGLRRPAQGDKLSVRDDHRGQHIRQRHYHGQFRFLRERPKAAGEPARNMTLAMR